MAYISRRCPQCRLRKSGWAHSAQTVHHLLGSLVSTGVLAPALVWAAAAVVLPWLVSGRSAALDVIRVIVWAAVVGSATGVAITAIHGSDPVRSPSGAAIGAVAAVAVALAPLGVAMWREALHSGRSPSESSVAWIRPKGRPMSVLKSLESKIAGLVEGTFSRAFRSEVRPVEIARKLAREMEEHKTYSLSRTYVPNEYRVYLSPRDRERFSEYEDALVSELTGYLLEHARRERLVLMSRPVLEFETDDRLGLGEFGIQTRVVTPEPEQRRARRPPGGREPESSGRTMVYSTAGRVAEPLEERARSRQQTALLLMGGKRLVVGPAGATMGRSRQCDVMVDDPNVSRTHAEVRPRRRLVGADRPRLDQRVASQRPPVGGSRGAQAGR